MPRGKRIDVPDHQRAFAIEQLTTCRHEPVLAARLRRVQHMESAGRIPPLVHRPDNGELPGPWLALKGEPLGRIVDRLHLAAPPKPEWPAFVQTSAVGRLAGGSMSLAWTTPPTCPLPLRTGRQYIRALIPLGSSTATASERPRSSASAAWPSSAVWSPGSSTCRAVSFIMTMSLLRASTIPLV